MLAASILKQALLVGTLLGEARPRSNAGQIMIGVASGLLFVGFCFLTYAGFIWASNVYGVQIAAAGVGTAIVLLALFVMGMAAWYFNERRIRIRNLGMRSAHKVEETIMSVLGALEDPIKDNPKLSVILSALTGYKAGKTVF